MPAAGSAPVLLLAMAAAGDETDGRCCSRVKPGAEFFTDLEKVYPMLALPR